MEWNDFMKVLERAETLPRATAIKEISILLLHAHTLTDNLPPTLTLSMKSSDKIQSAAENAIFFTRGQNSMVFYTVYKIAFANKPIGLARGIMVNGVRMKAVDLLYRALQINPENRVYMLKFHDEYARLLAGLYTICEETLLRPLEERSERLVRFSGEGPCANELVAQFYASMRHGTPLPNGSHYFTPPGKTAKIRAIDMFAHLRDPEKSRENMLYLELEEMKYNKKVQACYEGDGAKHDLFILQYASDRGLPNYYVD